MRKKNKKIHKQFALRFKASQEFTSSLNQFSLLIEEFKNKLIKTITKRGYAAISKAKVESFIDLKNNVENPISKYRLSIKAIYVGKRKAKELLNVTQK